MAPAGAVWVCRFEGGPADNYRHEVPAGRPAYSFWEFVERVEHRSLKCGDTERVELHRYGLDGSSGPSTRVVWRYRYLGAGVATRDVSCAVAEHRCPSCL